MTAQEKIIADAEKALKSGYHKKALKLSKEIEDENVKATIVARAEKLQAKAKEEAAQPKVEPETRKVLTPYSIVEKYDELLAILAEIESVEKQKARPYRFYYFHRRQIENLKRNFIKGMRL